MNDMESKTINVKNIPNSEFELKLEECGDISSKKYRANSKYIYRKIADMDVLLSVGDNIADFNGYVEMNSSALCLWKTMQEECSLSQLEQALENQFGITHEQAAEDVLDFLEVLQEHHMVEIY